MSELLPFIADVCREAREEAGARITGIADAAGYAATTSIGRFEKATAWPRDPDNVVGAYATSAGVSVFDLWDEAIRRAMAGASTSSARESEAVQAERAGQAAADARQETTKAPSRSSGKRAPKARRRRAG